MLKSKIPVCVVEDHCDVSTTADVQTPSSGIMRMCGCGARAGSYPRVGHFIFR